jgi:hypothetical protein
MNAIPESLRCEAQHTLGKPQVAGALAVYPVFGRAQPRLAYRAFAQAVELGALAKEREGRASVRALVVENPTDRPLLVYEGEEVLGAQQNRTFAASVLVAAGEAVELDVTCVEQGRWDSRRHGEHMRPSRQAADPSLRRLGRASAGAAGSADQAQVWSAVACRMVDHGVASPSAAMSDVFDRRRGDIDSLGRVVKHLDGQVGAVAAVAGRPVVLDLASRAEVFASLLPRLAQGYALDALGAPDRKPGGAAAAEFLHAALDAPRRESRTPGMGRGFALGSPAVIGSGLEHDGELIQVCAFPAGAGHPGARAASGAHIVRPSRRRP